MSAYAMPMTFKAMPSAAAADTSGKLSVADEAKPAFVLPHLKLPESTNDDASADSDDGRFGSIKIPPPRTPSRYKHNMHSETESIIDNNKTTDPSIKVKSVTLNPHLLTMSPRSVVRRGSGGGGGLASPRRQSRNVGRNGILDAIEVILFISLSGRIYSATRSLARIVELATDLNAETTTTNRDGTTTTTTTIPVLPSEIKYMTVSPPASPSGCVVRLQDRLDVVGDLLNDWFQRLLAVAGAADSLTLSSFLWEPLWLTTDGNMFSASPKRDSSSRDLVLSGSSSADASSSGSVETGTNSTSRTMSDSPRQDGIPLAFGRRRSSVRRRGRSSVDSVSTLGSIDESLLF